MKSSEKMDVVAKRNHKYDGKLWVEIKFKAFKDGLWIPSFEDLWRIVQAICHCEDDKYPNGEGRGMVERFLADCCSSGSNWEEIRTKYEIPER